MQRPPFPTSKVAAKVAPLFVAEGWEYRDHPRYGELAGRSVQIVRELITTPAQFTTHVTDSRPVHLRLFEGLTPAEQPDFAGHYRGENIPYLLEYVVRIGVDPRVGVWPAVVAQYMQDFSTKTSAWLDRLDAADARLTGTPLEHTFIDVLVDVVASIFVRFVAIHPYANGNGHLGRFIVWIVLVSRGFIPRSWPLDGRPDCDALIRAHLSGNTPGLEAFILKAITTPTPGLIAQAHI